jgi:hypothetical protein
MVKKSLVNELRELETLAHLLPGDLIDPFLRDELVEVIAFYKRGLVLSTDKLIFRRRLRAILMDLRSMYDIFVLSHA